LPWEYTRQPEVRKILHRFCLVIFCCWRCLGERLCNAAEALFAAGFSSVCFVGADSPTLPRSYLAQMVGYVSNIEKGAALGPSADGGYYTIVSKTFMPRLFEDIDWSTNRVFEQTMARINELAIPRLILPEWYDVDDWVGLRRLYGELSGLGRTRTAGLPGDTYAAIPRSATVSE
jgi:uncharacterized protein